MCLVWSEVASLVFDWDLVYEDDFIQLFPAFVDNLTKSVNEGLDQS